MSANAIVLLGLISGALITIVIRNISELLDARGKALAEHAELQREIHKLQIAQKRLEQQVHRLEASHDNR